MYLPRHFEEARADVLHRAINEHPFATVITLATNGLNANHVPLELAASEGPLGTLRGHVARANAMWRDVVPEVDALAVFQGPETYITPAWYRSKQETGKVTPTWNYVVVHAYGRLRIIDDRTWLRAHVGRLTARFEAPRATPWQVTDAPPDYLEALLGAIVGFEIPITRIEGKWKVSQNRSSADRESVVEGLRELGDRTSTVMADLIDLSAPRD
jgi:transcriptional regulator